MKKLYIQPNSSVRTFDGDWYVMTHVSGGLIRSTEEEDDPVNAW